MGKSLPHWLLEGLFIVMSVALAFGVGECREYRANRELATHVLRGIQTELEENLAVLEPAADRDRDWVNTIREVDLGKTALNDATTGLDVFFATRPPLPTDAKSSFVSLGGERGAWDAALSTGALRLLDYETVKTLSTIYQKQDLLSETLTRLATSVLYTPTASEQSNRKTSVRQLLLTMLDIYSIERALVDLYKQDLPAIRAAAGAVH